MPAPFIYIGTYRLFEGKEREYLANFRELAGIVQAEQPDMLYFAEHVAQDGGTSSTVQVHATADNMLRHMEVASDHIAAAAQFLDFSDLSIQILGTPTDAVMARMRAVAGSGATVTVSPPAVGFSRLAALDRVQPVGVA